MIPSNFIFLRGGHDEKHQTQENTEAEAQVLMSASNVVPIGGVTRLDLPVDRVLEGAKGTLDGVVILGYSEDGGEYFASTYADGGDVLWLLERCKHLLLEIASVEKE